MLSSIFRGQTSYIPGIFCGTVDGYIAAQQEILSMADNSTKIIPGHGSLTDKAGMQADIDMLIDGRALVKALLDQGMNVDDVLEANPLAKYDAFSWAFITNERMTRTFVRSMTSE